MSHASPNPTDPTQVSDVQQLTRRDRLIKNIGLNLLTQGVPAAIAVFTIPAMVHGYGVERFGVLTLIWALIGYSSLFDLGLGRALTQMISKKLGAGETAELPVLIWTALAMILVLGTLCAAVMALCAPWILTMLNISSPLMTEIRWSFYWLCLSIPFLFGLIAAKGVMESFQRFDLISIWRIPVVISNFVLPVGLLWYSHSLVPAVAAIALTRVLVFIGQLYTVGVVVPGFFSQMRLDKHLLAPLFHFGKWNTVSNVISPLIGYFDRFILSYLLSAGMVAYYSTPSEVLGRIGMVTACMVGVMFPALSTELVRDPQRAKRLYWKGIGINLLILLIPVLVIMVFAHPLLAWWISPAFANHSAIVAQVLALNILFGVVGSYSFALIQAGGRSDWTAYVYMGIAPIVLGAMFWFTSMWGLKGMALAMGVRAVLEVTAMSLLARRVLQEHIQGVGENPSGDMTPEAMDPDQLARTSQALEQATQMATVSRVKGSPS